MAYDQNNIFARIIRKELPVEVLYEDKDTLVFNDVAPQANVHILIIPKKSYYSFDDFTQNAPPEIVGAFFKTVQRIAKDHGLPETGYRLVTNHGLDGGQTVPHFHVHLLGKAALVPHFGKA